MTIGMLMLAAALVNPKTIRIELIKPMLPAHQDTLSETCVYNEIVEKDVAADLAWTRLGTRGEYDAHRSRLRSRMIEAIGGLPERTPLNARVTGIVRREGFRVEKVIFESVPGMYVTANLFVPEGPDMKPPYAGLILAMGHSEEGKGCKDYQRSGVKAALAGFAALSFDPIDQGERLQTPSFGSCRYPAGTRYGMGHNAIGIRAHLLGSSMAKIRIWDAMRAIDYLTGRTDVVRPGKIGYMGTSGGGTSTALMMALDDRIGAAAPSCFITSYRALLASMAPQDAEQQIFGMLSFGLNHLGLYVMGDVPGAVTSGHIDGFPHYGTYESWKIASDLAERLGEKGKYALVDMPGGHGWSEGNLDASLAWMRAWLYGEKSLLPLDMGRYRAENLRTGVERTPGLSYEESCAAPGGDVRNLPGAKDAFELLEEKLDRALAGRKPRTAAETSALVRRLAVIRDPASTGARRVPAGSVRRDGMTVERMIFAYPNGMALPGVLLVPDEVRGAPALTFADGDEIYRGRICTSDICDELLKSGRPVLALDITGCGEASRFRKFFYVTGKGRHAEEAMSVMLYILGESLVGRRASDILLGAEYLRKRFGAPVSLHPLGRVTIAAAHAFAADRSLISDVKVREAPASWTDLIRSRDYPYYCNSVNGALLHYDWTDLLKR